MSKVQDAINAVRGQREQRPGSRIAAAIRPLGRQTRTELAISTSLSQFPEVVVDTVRMEDSCLLPYVNDKAAINAYNQLRTRVLQQMRAQNRRSLIVTGTLPNEGKTTTAMNLAIAASMDVSKPVLLVDFDVERPSVAERLGLKRTAGLSDFLRGTADWQETVYNTNLDRLAVLPNFEQVDSTGAAVSQKMLVLLEEIKRIDRELFIVIDMPPILSSDQVLAIGPYADALLFVIAERGTNRALLERANEMIKGIPLVGIVLNRSMEASSAYY